MWYSLFCSRVLLFFLFCLSHCELESFILLHQFRCSPLRYFEIGRCFVEMSLPFSTAPFECSLFFEQLTLHFAYLPVPDLNLRSQCCHFHRQLVHHSADGVLTVFLPVSPRGYRRAASSRWRGGRVTSDVVAPFLIRCYKLLVFERQSLELGGVVCIT